MWNMALKDLYLQKHRLLWLLISAFLIVTILMSFNEIGFLPAMFIFTFVATYSFTMQTCYYEDKKNSLAFLRSIPVSEKDIVAGRFLAIALIIGGALILGFFTLVIFQSTTAYSFIWTDIITYGLIAGLFNFLLNCTIVYVYFRWGYSRVQIIYAVTFMVLFAGGMIAGTFAQKLPVYFKSISAIEVLGAFILLTAGMIVLLWNRSINTIKNMDIH